MARTRQYEAFSKKGDIKYKEKFLQQMESEKYQEKYIDNVESKLRKFAKFEDKYGKDLYDFTPSEIDDMLLSLRAGSIGNARFIRTIITKYINYAKSKNLGNLSLNIDELLSGDKIEKYVSVLKAEGKIINEKEVKNIVDGLWNPRDKAIMWLLWSGVMGKNFDEIRKLKKTDILWDKNAIVLSNRIIENIPNEVMNILKEAKDENNYTTNNEKTKKLIDDEYLIKAYDINRKVNTRNYMSKGSFLCFFTNLKKSEQFGDKSYITAKNIYRSGMLYNFDKYLKENNLEASKKTFTEFRDKYYQEVADSSYYDLLKTLETVMTLDDDNIK